MSQCNLKLRSTHLRLSRSVPHDMEVVDKDEAGGQGEQQGEHRADAGGGLDCHIGRTYIALTQEAIVSFIKSQPARQSPAGTHELTVKQFLDQFDPAVKREKSFKAQLKMLIKSGAGCGTPPPPTFPPPRGLRPTPPTGTHTHCAPSRPCACMLCAHPRGPELARLRLERHVDVVAQAG